LIKKECHTMHLHTSWCGTYLLTALSASPAVKIMIVEEKNICYKMVYYKL